MGEKIKTEAFERAGRIAASKAQAVFDAFGPIIRRAKAITDEQYRRDREEQQQRAEEHRAELSARRRQWR